ncbi:hypothetical protein GCM10010975_06740 [Comamonas phosphati]|nr:hypothetical protein GCM10010975_06740 [Comamonas phosphati]
MLKKILGVYEAPRPHWVGNGFPVRSLFSYGDHGKALSPFLLLDHAGPENFTPTTARRGVGTSSTRAKWPTATPRVPAAASAPATCSG